MTATPPYVRLCAAAAPLLILLYGLCRFLDGLDGDRGNGPAWDIGHVLFFVAFVLLGVLLVGTRRMVLDGAGTGRRVVADILTVAGMIGVACFLWVIAGDLSADLREAAPLPDALEIAGPLLYQLGALGLLVMLVGRRFGLPWWSPVLVLAGFVAIAIQLDLLPLGALLIMAGLAPLAMRPRTAARHHAEA